MENSAPNEGKEPKSPTPEATPVAPPAPNAAPATSDRIPLRDLVCFASGGIPLQYSYTTVNQLTNPILNMTLGVNPAWISICRTINTVIDAITDPIMGYVSDNFKSRWGRRKPFIAIGGAMLAVTTAAFWWLKPTWGPMGLMAWFLAAMIVYSLGTTVFGTAFYALGVEMTPDYHERTRLNVVTGYFRSFAGLLVPWFIWFIARPFWASGRFGPEAFGRLYGARALSLIIAGAFLLVALPLIFVRERYGKLAAREMAKKKIGFFASFGHTMRNRNFLILTATGLLMGFGLNLFEQLSSYVNFYYVFKGDIRAASVVGGTVGTVGVVMAMMGGLAVWVLARRIGKHNVLRLAMVGMLIGCLLKWFCYTPEHPWRQAIVPFFYSIGIASFFMVLGAMNPDVIDSDELITGLRREAMFSGVGNLVGKMVGATGIMLSGFLINWTGFDVKLAGAQTPETFLRMRLMFSFAPAVTIVLALIVVSFYQLTPKRMVEIRAELERRRGTV